MIQYIWIVNYDTYYDTIIPSQKQLMADANSTTSMTRQQARLIIVSSINVVNPCPGTKYADVESR
jgi:hypothetical protein